MAAMRQYGAEAMKIGDDTTSRIPKAIKAHQLAQNHDMKNGLGSDVRKDRANERVAKDIKESTMSRAEKYVGDKDRSSLVTSKDVTRESGATKGQLTRALNKAKENDLGR
jgi:hypothetical protein